MGRADHYDMYVKAFEQCKRLSMENKKLTAELAAKDKALEYIACSCQDCPDLGTKECEEQEYCVNKVAQQALKGNSDS